MAATESSSVGDKYPDSVRSAAKADSAFRNRRIDITFPSTKAIIVIASNNCPRENRPRRLGIGRESEFSFISVGDRSGLEGEELTVRPVPTE